MPGGDVPRELAEIDLVRHLEALVTGLSVPACSDDGLLSSSDDDSAFIRSLLRRIGMQPLLADVAFTFSSAEKHLLAAAGHDDLTDSGHDITMSPDISPFYKVDVLISLFCKLAAPLQAGNI